MFERTDCHYTPVESGLIRNMKSAYEKWKAMQAAATKQKQDAKALYSMLTIAKQFSPWSMPITSRLTRTKVNAKKILSRVYSANKTITTKTLPTWFSSTTITVTSPITIERTTAAHSLPWSWLLSTITVTSTKMTESPSSSQVADDEMIASARKRKKNEHHKHVCQEK